MTEREGDIEAGVCGDVDGDVNVAASAAAEPASEANPLYSSLYHESLQAFLFSNLIMCLPPLRDWGREGSLQGEPDRLDRLQNLPCTGADVCAIFQDNQELFTKEGGLLNDKNKLALYQQALGLDSAYTSHVLFGNHSYHDILQGLEMHVLSDYRQQTDIVYMVAVSHLLKQVLVIFRGSTTPKDYKQDIKVLLASIPNPIDPKEEYVGREDELGMHLGFRQYLYTEESITKVLYKPKIYKTFLSLMSNVTDKSENDAVTEAADRIAAQDPRTFGLARGNQTRDLKKALQLPCKYQLIIEQALDLLEEHKEY